MLTKLANTTRPKLAAASERRHRRGRSAGIQLQRVGDTDQQLILGGLDSSTGNINRCGPAEDYGQSL